MKASEHILGGVIATTLTYLVASAITGESPNLEGLLMAGLVGIPTGLMLDWIEPANKVPRRQLRGSRLEQVIRRVTIFE